MSEQIFLARLFLISGLVLALLGLVLWFILPITSIFPPYIVTAFIALGYGGYCLLRGRSSGARKP